MGAKACAKCHAAIHQGWSSSLHSRILQPASPASVLGDFSQARVEIERSPFVLRRTGAGYSITESIVTGKPWEHVVNYTLGSRRFQHYLSTLPDGRILIIPATWDIQRKKWTLDTAIGNPEESPEIGRASCRERV